MCPRTQSETGAYSTVPHTPSVERLKVRTKSMTFGGKPGLPPQACVCHGHSDSKVARKDSGASDVWPKTSREHMQSPTAKSQGADKGKPRFNASSLPCSGMGLDKPKRPNLDEPTSGRTQSELGRSPLRFGRAQRTHGQSQPKVGGSNSTYDWVKSESGRRQPN